MSRVLAKNQGHEPLRIVIVHQEPLFRLGLRSVLERQGMQIAGETTRLEEILDVVTSKQPDVILLDGAFCDAFRTLSAADVVMRIRQAGARGIIVLVATPDEEQLFWLLLAGAAAYALDRLESDSLVEMVRRVAAGEYLLTEEVLSTDTRPPARSRPPKPLPKRVTPEPEAVTQTRERLGITDREIEVLQCVMRGLSNVRIGRVLGITHHTAKNHIMHLFGKFNVRDRTAAVVYALRHGLISWDDPLPQDAVRPQGSSTERYREELAV
jgi:DNA-binding NarL/FixJ family response regulator